MANVGEKADKSGLFVYSTKEKQPSLTVETIHISCSSDAYSDTCRKTHQYGGIIIYNREPSTKHDGVVDGKQHTLQEWHGYLVIKDTDCKPKPQDEFPSEGGAVHGAIYRKVFGESCKEKKSSEKDSE